MTIEGIPDGWELVGVRSAEHMEAFIDNDGSIAYWAGKKKSVRVFPIIRKIEKPKQYRPFANAAEFLAHPLNGDFLDAGYGFYEKVTKCNDNGIYFITDLLEKYDEAFCDYKFRDGTPFGIEVTE